MRVTAESDGLTDSGSWMYTVGERAKLAVERLHKGDLCRNARNSASA